MVIARWIDPFVADVLLQEAGELQRYFRYKKNCHNLVARATSENDNGFNVLRPRTAIQADTTTVFGL